MFQLSAGLAREQGNVLGKALDHMLTEVADDGQEKQVSTSFSPVKISLDQEK